MDNAPLWAVLLIGLGSGALGAFATTWYRARHERHEADRDRRTQACYDFLRATDAAMGATRDILDWLTKNRVAHVPEETLAPTIATGDALVAARARIVLLFGPDAAISATTEAMCRAHIDVRRALQATPPGFGTAYDNMTRMGDLLDDEFLATAYHGMIGQRGRWSRLFP
jgi:hypothetical protein